MTNRRPAMLAVLLGGMLFSACSNSMSEINELVNKTSQDDRGIDVTVLYSKNGKIQARLFTHELIRNESATPPFTDMKNGMKVEFFNDSAHVVNTLTARNARWYEQENNIIIRDSVVVVNDKGERLDTQELVWNASIQKFFSEKRVSITTPTHTITGTGMVADQDFHTFEVSNPITTVKVNKKEVPGG